jgi:hypothetical protein
MTTSTSWSAIGFVSMTAGLWILGACSSDSAKPGASAEAGAGGKGGTGNRSSLGGRTGSGGGVSAGGRGTVDAGSCTTAVGVTCDGPEDCPAGQRCCGKYQQQYVEFGCFDSCIAQQGDAQPALGGGALWFDLCHPGDACEDSTAQCLTSAYLPKSLSRCLPASLMGMAMGGPPNATLGKGKDQVNCGTDVCGTGEKCCIRGATLAPYCAPSGATCDCTVPTAAADSGKPPVKPGPDATTPPTDAATRD